MREGLGNVVGNVADFAPYLRRLVKLPGLSRRLRLRLFNPRRRLNTGACSVKVEEQRGNKIRIARVVPELIDRGVKATSLKNLGETVAEKMESAAGDALDKTYESLPEGAGIPLSKVLRRMKNAVSRRCHGG